MIVINIAVISGILFLSLLPLKEEKYWMDNLKEKSYILRWLYPAAFHLIRLLRLDRYFQSREKMNQALRSLEVSERPQMVFRKYWCQRIALILFVAVIFQILCIVSHISSLNQENFLKQNSLRRPDIGKGGRAVRLSVIREGTEELESEQTELHLTVQAREYKEEELERVFQKGYEYLEKMFLGENQDKGQIKTNLNFIERLDERRIRVEWRSSDPKRINRKGEVFHDDLAPEGEMVKVSALLSYHEIKKEYEWEVRVIPPDISEQERIRKKLDEEIQRTAEESSEEEYWTLPEEVEGYQLKWGQVKKSSTADLLILGVLTGFILWIYGDRKLSGQIEKRKRQLILDYPDLINKFTLLVNAGMTIRQAWIKIADDYKIKRESGRIKPRYAYEEMRLTIQEIRNGVPEGEAYEQFGRRTGILAYMRFGTLITQNLRKGNKGLAEELNREAIEAFSERKEQAKRLGEEAGTKLVGAMAILFGMVLVILLFPAFISMGI